jgi:ribonuclease P protein component
VQQTTALRHTLCKDERLSRRKLIEELHSEGFSLKSPAIILVYRFTEVPCEFPAQAMFSVSKRIFKRAHDRNRVKRLLREAYRKQKQIVYSSLREKGQQATLHFIFTGKQLPNQAYVFGKLTDLMSRFSADAIAQLPDKGRTEP